MLMPVLKKIALGILSPLFIFLLFATAFDIGFVRTATHPVTVKKLVSESGIYNSVIPNVLQQTKSISTGYGDIPVTDPALQKAANVALPAPYIQQNTEMAIDNLYDWLNGKIAQPNFRIDLSGAKTLFANNIADALQKRISALPVCTLAESRAITASGSFDAYNATCLPRGTNAATITEQFKAGIVNQKDFLQNTTVEAASIKDNKGQSVFDQAGIKNIPKQYQRAKKTPLILSVLTILCGLGIVLLSSTWQKGLRHIGINLLIIGLVMLLFSWALNRTVSKNIVPKIKVDSAIFQQDLRSLVTDVAQQIDKNYWFFGGVYMALGAGSIILSEVFRRRLLPPAPVNAVKTPRSKPAGRH
jgi:protein-S-isoprenylcysteine O-methyltransferase Ste14